MHDIRDYPDLMAGPVSALASAMGCSLDDAVSQINTAMRFDVEAGRDADWELLIRRLQQFTPYKRPYASKLLENWRK